MAEHKCDRCGKTDKEVYNYDTVYQVMNLCEDCYGKIANSKNQTKFVGIEKVEQGMQLMLEGLRDEYGLDITDENFNQTPKRVARAYAEIFDGINSEEEIKNILKTSFPSQYSGMVVSSNIRAFSMCPHHFLPVEYKVNLAYIPDKKTVGLSKLGRVIELSAHKPELQEMFTQNIHDYINKYLEPKGVIVQVWGRHMCMAMRGVKKDSWTLTSSISGAFTQPVVRSEYQMMINKEV